MSADSQRKSPAFQFYADDFLAGTSEMTAEEVGGYVRLLCHQWSKGGIPNDEERAARMAGLIGSPSIRYVLAKFVLCQDGLLKNERLEQVRADQAAYRLKQAQSGRSGAEKRWQKHGDPNGDPNRVAMANPMAKRWPEDSSPSPSPNKYTLKDINKREGIKRFAPPEVEELSLEASKIGLPADEAEKFSAYYGANGWRVGKNQMKSWRHALAGWAVRWRQNQSKPNGNLIGTNTPDDSLF